MIQKLSNGYSPYEDFKFWRAYAELYWPDLEGNRDLKKFGDGLADLLPRRQLDEPVTILILGCGFGGVELPVLYHLKRKCKARLRCICIDRASLPTLFAAHILRNGIEGLPRNSEQLVSSLQEFKKVQSRRPVAGGSVAPRQPVSPSDGDEFIFINDDLNWEPNVFPPKPSAWQSRLDAHLPASQRFDLIFAAFSLFHIDWWRCVVMESANRLKPDGLLLHAKVEGDENIFEGRMGCSDSDNSTARQFFLEGLFYHPQVEPIAKSPRDGSASQPLAIEAFLSRLEDFGFSRLADFRNTPAGTFPDGYTVPARVGLATYSALLKTKGFSTFRRIADQLGEDKYRSICASIRKSVGKGAAIDTLAIFFHWTAYRLSIPSSLNQFPLGHRFLRKPKPLNLDPSVRALDDAYVTSHELSNPLRLHERLDDEQQLAQKLGRRLNLQGLLHDDCVALEFGLYPKQGNRTTWSFAGNALYYDSDVVRRTVEEVALYLMLLAERSRVIQRNFSNTKALLETILPMFQKAPVLIYDLEQDGYSLRHDTRLEFEEFRFGVPSLGAEEREVWDKGVNQMRSWLAEKAFSQKGQALRDDPDNPPDVLTAPKSCSEGAFLRLFDQIYQPPTRLETICEQIGKSFRGSCELPELVQEKIIQTVTPAMAFTLRCLKLLSKVKQVVFYPARYELEEGGYGKDLIICVYSRTLSVSEITSEFHKFDQFFDEIKMHRVASSSRTGGVEETIRAFSHEISKQTSMLFGTQLQSFGAIFRVNDLTRQNNVKDETDWPEEAGTVLVNNTYKEFIASWLVCPTPIALESVRSLLRLWGGSPEWTSELGFAAGQDLICVIKRCWAIALKAAIAVDLKNEGKAGDIESAVSINGIQSSSSWKSVPQLVPDVGGSVGFAWHSGGVSAKDQEAISMIQSFFIRALVAAATNAITFASKMTDSRVFAKVHCEKTKLIISLRNACNLDTQEDLYRDGTAAVIRLCVRQMGGNPERVFHGRDPLNAGLWLTSFTCPVEANRPVKSDRASAPLEWLTMKTQTL